MRIEDLCHSGKRLNENYFEKSGDEVRPKQAAHIANAKVNYTTLDLDTEAEIIAAFNATNTAINSILTALENAGVLASS